MKKILALCATIMFLVANSISAQVEQKKYKTESSDTIENQDSISCDCDTIQLTLEDGYLMLESLQIVTLMESPDVIERNKDYTIYNEDGTGVLALYKLFRKPTLLKLSLNGIEVKGYEAKIFKKTENLFFKFGKKDATEIKVGFRIKIIEDKEIAIEIVDIFEL